MKTRRILIALVVFNIVALGLSEIQRRSLVKRIYEIGKAQDLRIDELHKSMDLLRILAEKPSPDAKKQIEAIIATRLISGRKIGVIFYSGADVPSRSPCGKSASNSPLDAFLPAQTYEVSYDATTHKWTGSGPNRHLAGRDDTCKTLVAVYGPKELLADVTPDQGVVSLWGAPFTLDGDSLLWKGRAIGRVNFSTR